MIIDSCSFIVYFVADNVLFFRRRNSIKRTSRVSVTATTSLPLSFEVPDPNPAAFFSTNSSEPAPYVPSTILIPSVHGPTHEKLDLNLQPLMERERTPSPATELLPKEEQLPPPPDPLPSISGSEYSDVDSDLVFINCSGMQLHALAVFWHAKVIF